MVHIACIKYNYYISPAEFSISADDKRYHHCQGRNQTRFFFNQINKHPHPICNIYMTNHALHHSTHIMYIPLYTFTSCGGMGTNYTQYGILFPWCGGVGCTIYIIYIVSYIIHRYLPTLYTEAPKKKRNQLCSINHKLSLLTNHCDDQRKFIMYKHMQVISERDNQIFERIEIPLLHNILQNIERSFRMTIILLIMITRNQEHTIWCQRCIGF